MRYLQKSLLFLIILLPITYSVNAQSNTTNITNISSGSNISDNQTIPFYQNNNNNKTTISSESNQNKTTFRSAFDTYIIEKPELYGVYKEKGSNVFKPGETISLYIEPVGYKYQNLTDDKGNKYYIMDFSADFAIYNNNGTEVFTQKNLPAGHIQSHHPNKEMYLPFTITQSTPFPQGNYSIKYTIHDGNSGNSFDIIKNITIS